MSFQPPPHPFNIQQQFTREDFNVFLVNAAQRMVASRPKELWLAMAEFMAQGKTGDSIQSAFDEAARFDAIGVIHAILRFEQEVMGDIPQVLR